MRRFFSFLFYLCSITIYLAYYANCKLISFSCFSLASIAPEVEFMFAFCCTFKGFDYCLFIIFRMFVNFVDFSLHSPCTPLTLSFSFFFRIFFSLCCRYFNGVFVVVVVVVAIIVPSQRMYIIPLIECYFYHNFKILDYSRHLFHYGLAGAQILSISQLKYKQTFKLIFVFFPSISSSHLSYSSALSNHVLFLLHLFTFEIIKMILCKWQSLNYTIFMQKWYFYFVPFFRSHRKMNKQKIKLKFNLAFFTAIDVRSICALKLVEMSLSVYVSLLLHVDVCVFFYSVSSRQHINEIEPLLVYICDQCYISCVYTYKREKKSELGDGVVCSMTHMYTDNAEQVTFYVYNAM